MSDLTPDVRDRAAQAASDARREYDNATLYVNEAGRNLHIVDAVAAVVAPEIERQLKARITDLKTENLHLSLELEARDDAQWDLHQRLLPELAEAKEENQRLHDVVHRERPSVGDMVIELPQLRADRDALQARIVELEGQLERAESSGTGWVKAALQLGGNEERLQARVAELQAEIERVSQLARDRDDAVFSLEKRVELLTAALTTVVNLSRDGSWSAIWIAAWGNARAALAAGGTESEAAPWIRCTCGHSPHKHGDGGTIPPTPTARCHAAHDFDHDCLCEGYRPESESEAP